MSPSFSTRTEEEIEGHEADSSKLKARVKLEHTSMKVRAFLELSRARNRGREDRWMDAELLQVEMERPPN